MAELHYRGPSGGLQRYGLDRAGNADPHVQLEHAPPARSRNRGSMTEAADALSMHRQLAYNLDMLRSAIGPELAESRQESWPAQILGASRRHVFSVSPCV